MEKIPAPVKIAIGTAGAAAGVAFGLPVAAVAGVVATATLTGGAVSTAVYAVCNWDNLSWEGAGSAFVSGAVDGYMWGGIGSAVAGVKNYVFVGKVRGNAYGEKLGCESGGSVIYGSEDIGNYTYHMIENPGPLAEMPNQPAKNFYGGRYNMEVLQEDRILYRAGNSENPYGRWFTSEPPASVANVRIDTAVKPHWINPKTGAWEASSYIDNVYAIKIPKGTTIYTGPVGPQGGTCVGGYNIMQTYIDSPWTFEVVGKRPLQ